MFNNIIKLALIAVIMSTMSISYAAKPQAADDNNIQIQSKAGDMMLAKGQYYNDSRNYKPATC